MAEDNVAARVKRSGWQVWACNASLDVNRVNAACAHALASIGIYIGLDHAPIEDGQSRMNTRRV